MGPILAFEPHESSIFSKLAWRFGAMVVNLPPSPQTPMIVMESWVLPTQQGWGWSLWLAPPQTMPLPTRVLKGMVAWVQVATNDSKHKLHNDGHNLTHAQQQWCKLMCSQVQYVNPCLAYDQKWRSSVAKLVMGLVQQAYSQKWKSSVATWIGWLS